MPPVSNVLIVLTLFATFAFGANLACAGHEFGHALGCWLAGGQVTEFVLRPFDFSYVGRDMGTAPPWGHMLASGGGILFGTLLVLPLWPLTRVCRPGSASWLLVSMTITLAFGLNGVLLLVSAATGAGDPQMVLIYGSLGYGIPDAVWRALFLVLGMPLTALFVRQLLRLLRALYPGEGVSYGRWLLTVELGLMSYFILMIAHTTALGDRAILARQFLRFYVPFMVMLAVLIGLAATRVYRTASAGLSSETDSSPPTWGKAGVLLALAGGVIGCELAFLGPQDS